MKILYAGTSSLTSFKYQDVVKAVLEEVSGHARICGVTSDNIAACINARKIYAKTFIDVASVNDQANIVDLPTWEVETFSWIKDVVENVFEVASALHWHSKMKALYKEVMHI